jgi:hypothetical protein
MISNQCHEISEKQSGVPDHFGNAGASIDIFNQGNYLVF